MNIVTAIVASTLVHILHRSFTMAAVDRKLEP